MTSINDGKDVKSIPPLTSKGKTYYIELYKTLDARLAVDLDLRTRAQCLCEAWGCVHSLCKHSSLSTHPHLLNWLQRNTAQTILQSEWQSPKSADLQTSLAQSLDSFIQETNLAISERNGIKLQWETQLLLQAENYKKVLSDPWGHPVLRLLLDPNGKQPNDNQVLEWLTEERGITFVSRLRQLSIAKKCDDIALSLASAVLDRSRTLRNFDDNVESTVTLDQLHRDGDDSVDSTEAPKDAGGLDNEFSKCLKRAAGFTNEVWDLLTDIELVLLHRLGKTAQCIDLIKQLPLRYGHQVIERLRTRLELLPKEKKLWKNSKDVAILVAQVMVARCMVVLSCAGVCRHSLYWCTRALVRLVPAQRLPNACAALAAPAVTARHLHTLAAAVEAQSDKELRPFVCELYIRAITAGMNELEQLKLKTEKASEARLTEQTLANWFLQLSELLKGNDRIVSECLLTAFSVHPSKMMFERLLAMPVLPGLTFDTEKLENTPSSFGSWATDSRSTTNLVKTSETLNLKKISQRANVVSTVVLSEGEKLGLSPELCQDLAVLLSGPRIKTLSWDTDRRMLLENCRVYMEKTGAGTRSLTTELKYLNLDPSQFQHLPEESDDENDIYYGIEKGYEHLVDAHESPETVWENNLDNPGSFFNDADFVIESNVEVSSKIRHKKSILSSDDDKDPLSLGLESHHGGNISKEKKKKDRSSEKHHKVKHAHRDSSQSLEKRKYRSNKEKSKDKVMKSQFDEQTNNPRSLSNLIGLKVTPSDHLDTKKICEKKKRRRKQKDEQGDKITNSNVTLNNDKLEKNTLCTISGDTIPYQGTVQSNVLFDGLFSMDDLKTITKEQVLENSVGSQIKKEMEVTDFRITMPGQNIGYSNNMSNDVEKFIPPKTTEITTKHIKHNIGKLIQFRKQKVNNAAINVSQYTKVLDPHNIYRNEKANLGIINNMEQKNNLHEEDNLKNPRMVDNIQTPCAKVITDTTHNESTVAFINRHYPHLQFNSGSNKHGYVGHNQSPDNNNSTVIQHVDKTRMLKAVPAQSNTFHLNNQVHIIKKPIFTKNYDIGQNLHQQVNSLLPHDELKAKNMLFNGKNSTINRSSDNIQDFIKNLKESINTGTNTIASNEKSLVQALGTSTPSNIPKVIDPATASFSNKMDGYLNKNVLQSNSPKSNVILKGAKNSSSYSRLNYLHKSKQESKFNRSSGNTKLIECDSKNQDFNSELCKQKLAPSHLNNSNHKVNPKELSRVPASLLRSSQPVVSHDKFNLSNQNSSSYLKTNINKNFDWTTHGGKGLSLLKTDSENQFKLHVNPNQSSNVIMQIKDVTVKKTLDTNNASRAIKKPSICSFDNSINLKLYNQNKNYIKSDQNNIVPNQSILSEMLANHAVKRVSNNNAYSYDSVENCQEKKQMFSSGVNKSNAGHNKQPDFNIGNEVKALKNAPNLGTIKITYNNDKIEEKINKEQDWEAVMDKLLSHRTPSRGENALDLKFKKDKIIPSTANKLRQQRKVRPNVIATMKKDININATVNDKSNKTTVTGDGIIKKLLNTQPNNHHIQCDVLDDLLDKDLLQEISELTSDEEMGLDDEAIHKCNNKSKISKAQSKIKQTLFPIPQQLEKQSLLSEMSTPKPLNSDSGRSLKIISNITLNQSYDQIKKTENTVNIRSPIVKEVKNTGSSMASSVSCKTIKVPENTIKETLYANNDNHMMYRNYENILQKPPTCLTISQTTCTVTSPLISVNLAPTIMTKNLQNGMGKDHFIDTPTATQQKPNTNYIANPKDILLVFGSNMVYNNCTITSSTQGGLHRNINTVNQNQHLVKSTPKDMFCTTPEIAVKINNAVKLSGMNVMGQNAVFGKNKTHETSLLSSKNDRSLKVVPKVGDISSNRNVMSLKVKHTEVKNFIKTNLIDKNINDNNNQEQKCNIIETPINDTNSGSKHTINALSKIVSTKLPINEGKVFKNKIAENKISYKCEEDLSSASLLFNINVNNKGNITLPLCDVKAISNVDANTRTKAVHVNLKNNLNSDSQLFSNVNCKSILAPNVHDIKTISQVNENKSSKIINVNSVVNAMTTSQVDQNKRTEVIHTSSRELANSDSTLLSNILLNRNIAPNISQDYENKSAEIMKWKRSLKSDISEIKYTSQDNENKTTDVINASSKAHLDSTVSNINLNSKLKFAPTVCDSNTILQEDKNKSTDISVKTKFVFDMKSTKVNHNETTYGIHVGEEHSISDAAMISNRVVKRKSKTASRLCTMKTQNEENKSSTISNVNCKVSLKSDTVVLSDIRSAMKVKENKTTGAIHASKEHLITDSTMLSKILVKRKCKIVPDDGNTSTEITNVNCKRSIKSDTKILSSIDTMKVNQNEITQIIQDSKEHSLPDSVSNIIVKRKCKSAPHVSTVKTISQSKENKNTEISNINREDFKSVAIVLCDKKSILKVNQNKTDADHASSSDNLNSESTMFSNNMMPEVCFNKINYQGVKNKIAEVTHVKYEKNINSDLSALSTTNVTECLKLSNAQRLRDKRLLIMNRVVNTKSSYAPIPLPYLQSVLKIYDASIISKSNINNRKNKACNVVSSGLTNSVTTRSCSSIIHKEDYNNGHLNVESRDTVELESTKNIDFKNPHKLENIIPPACKSVITEEIIKAIDSDKAICTNSTKNRKIRNSKRNKKNLTHVSNNEIETSENTGRRVSKRLSNRKNVVKDETFELIDFEQELIGAKIPKMPLREIIPESTMSTDMPMTYDQKFKETSTNPKTQYTPLEPNKNSTVTIMQNNAPNSNNDNRNVKSFRQSKILRHGKKKCSDNKSNICVKKVQDTTKNIESVKNENDNGENSSSCSGTGNTNIKTNFENDSANKNTCSKIMLNKHKPVGSEVVKKDILQAHDVQPSSTKSCHPFIESVTHLDSHNEGTKFTKRIKIKMINGNCFIATMAANCDLDVENFVYQSNLARTISTLNKKKQYTLTIPAYKCKVKGKVNPNTLKQTTTENIDTIDLISDDEYSTDSSTIAAELKHSKESSALDNKDAATEITIDKPICVSDIHIVNKNVQCNTSSDNNLGACVNDAFPQINENNDKSVIVPNDCITVDNNSNKNNTVSMKHDENIISIPSSNSNLLLDFENKASIKCSSEKKTINEIITQDDKNTNSNKISSKCDETIIATLPECINENKDTKNGDHHLNASPKYISEDQNINEVIENMNDDKNNIDITLLKECDSNIGRIEDKNVNKTLNIIYDQNIATPLKCIKEDQNSNDDIAILNKKDPIVTKPPKCFAEGKNQNINGEIVNITPETKYNNYIPFLPECISNNKNMNDDGITSSDEDKMFKNVSNTTLSKCFGIKKEIKDDITFSNKYNENHNLPTESGDKLIKLKNHPQIVNPLPQVMISGNYDCLLNKTTKTLSILTGGFSEQNQNNHTSTSLECISKNKGNNTDNTGKSKFSRKDIHKGKNVVDVRLNKNKEIKHHDNAIKNLKSSDEMLLVKGEDPVQVMIDSDMKIDENKLSNEVNDLDTVEDTLQQTADFVCTKATHKSELSDLPNTIECDELNSLKIALLEDLAPFISRETYVPNDTIVISDSDSECDNSKGIHLDKSVKKHIIDKHCIVSLVRCDDLIHRQKNMRKHFMPDCYVKLTRCDDLISTDLNANRSSKGIYSCNDIPEYSHKYTDNVVHRHKGNEEYHSCGRTSPVMEVYEVLVNLKSRTGDAPYSLLTCNAEWFYSKKDYFKSLNVTNCMTQHYAYKSTVNYSSALANYDNGRENNTCDDFTNNTADSSKVKQVNKLVPTLLLFAINVLNESCLGKTIVDKSICEKALNYELTKTIPLNLMRDRVKHVQPKPRNLKRKIVINDYNDDNVSKSMKFDDLDSYTGKSIITKTDIQELNVIEHEKVETQACIYVFGYDEFCVHSDYNISTTCQVEAANKETSFFDNMSDICNNNKMNNNHMDILNDISTINCNKNDIKKSMKNQKNKNVTVCNQTSITSAYPGNGNHDTGINSAIDSPPHSTCIVHDKIESSNTEGLTKERADTLFHVGHSKDTHDIQIESTSYSHAKILEDPTGFTCYVLSKHAESSDASCENNYDGKCDNTVHTKYVLDICHEDKNVDSTVDRVTSNSTLNTSVLPIKRNRVDLDSEGKISSIVVKSLEGVHQLKTPEEYTKSNVLFSNKFTEQDNPLINKTLTDIEISREDGKDVSAPDENIQQSITSPTENDLDNVIDRQTKSILKEGNDSNVIQNNITLVNREKMDSENKAISKIDLSKEESKKLLKLEVLQGGQNQYNIKILLNYSLISTDDRLSVIKPMKTYSTEPFRMIKRKIGMKDVNVIGKRFRKCKNIDMLKHRITNSIEMTSYKYQFKRLIDYYNSLKCSLSLQFHKDNVEIENIVSEWPINHPTNIDNIAYEKDNIAYEKDDIAYEKDNNEVHVFNEECTNKRNKLNITSKTFLEEINENIENDITMSDNEETIYMGFGEGSDRVIPNLKDDCIKLSAATLSDVKHIQPCILSEDKNHMSNLLTEKLTKLEQHFSFLNMRAKVKSFFEKNEIELNNYCIKKASTNNGKNCNTDPLCTALYNVPGLHETEFIEPFPMQQIVQVVQVGQLPVSAAAQNPVSCDSRVSQATDASPSQYSVDSSPHSENAQTSITKAKEYTELTTADIPLTIVTKHLEENNGAQSVIIQTQSCNMEVDDNVLKEVSEETEIDVTLEESNKNHEETFENSQNTQLHNIHFQFDDNHTNPVVTSEPPLQLLFNASQINSCDEFSQLKENGTAEKNDQIANAMNAAGIATTNERAHSLVNVFSQKFVGPQPITSSPQSTCNTYSKSTSINAMSLQQALAQILPPPLNHAGSDGQQQQAPQVLHIVQGKNSAGNQITLVDNSQQSVISSTNATQVLHIIQNKSTNNSTANDAQPSPSNSFSGISLVDGGLQQGNQLLHIVNAGSNQKCNNGGQILKRVNLLTNLTNVQTNEQKMVQFVCKSADGKAIQVNAAHQRSMVLRLQPIETSNTQTMPLKQIETSSVSPSSSVSPKDATALQQEIKSRSMYEENYAKFIQNSSNKVSLGGEKSTTLPKFNQAFGKTVFQEGVEPKANEISGNESQLQNITNTENSDSTSDNTISLEQLNQINSPPLLIRKSPAHTTQAQHNIVQQIKQTLAPMNIQTMHGGVIYTRQIPVNIGGGQTINLITVPTTELIDESMQKQGEIKFVTQGDMEPSIIKIVPQTPAPNAEVSPDEGSPHMVTGENTQRQPVLTQMRIKLPMLSKAPQVLPGTRVVRPSFFQIQRNVIGGANQPIYQQLVLTAAPPLGTQTIRLPQPQITRQVKVANENHSPESQLSSSTLEQLREFDMVLEQVKERSTVQPGVNANICQNQTPSIDSTESSVAVTTIATEHTQQVLYSIGGHQGLNVAYVNRKTFTSTPAATTLIRSPDSSGLVDSPSSTQASHHTASEPPTESLPKPVKSVSKPSKSRPSRITASLPAALRVAAVPPKTSSQKPLEDEQTTQRILYILAEYKEQVENSPDKDKPAPRRRNNLPPNPPGSSKRKKSSSSSRRPGCTRDTSPVNDDPNRTMGSEDSSCGTSQGDCNENCSIDTQSPQDSPRKVARKLTFDQETTPLLTQPRPQPHRNVIVADGQTITLARGTSGKPATAVLMPTNYILPVSMVKGGQQIAIVTHRGPKLLTVGPGEGGAANALLLQRLIGPGGLKPVLTRPGVRHVRLPASALHNLQAFNIATTTSVQQAESTTVTTPPDLVQTRRPASQWCDQESADAKPSEETSSNGQEPWRSSNTNDFSYKGPSTPRNDVERTVLGSIPDRFSPDMEAQQIFDKIFDTKKSFIVDPQQQTSQVAQNYEIDASHSESDDKIYHQVVQKRDHGSGTSHSITGGLQRVSAAALQHKYAMLEHELRLQKSLSEECEDLGVDSPSASELFPEAELLFSSSPAHETAPEQSHAHSHCTQTVLHHNSVPQPDLEDQIATEHVLPEPKQLLRVTEASKELQLVGDRGELTDVNLDLGDVGIVTVSEDGLQATINVDHEEFARSHPNTTFHSEPNDDTEGQPLTIADLKGRQITSTIFHSHSTVLMAAPTHTVISQATVGGSAQSNTIKYSDIDNIINSIPHNPNVSSVLVKDDGVTRFDNIIHDNRELHLSNATSAIVHAGTATTQVIRRVCYEEEKRDVRDSRFLLDESDAIIAGDDAKMAVIEDNSRDATLESMAGDVDDDRSSPERHTELFWESNSASERSESRRPLDFSSDSDKCCKSPSFDETNSTDSSGIGTHLRLDSVIKEARSRDRSGSAEGSSADDASHPPVRTYPPKRSFHLNDSYLERSLTGKTRAGEGSPECAEGRRRASGRGVVKRGCHCCNGSPAPPRPKKPRPRKPTMDFMTSQ